MADQPMPAPGDVVGGKYVIEELLGEGGMGAVYAASHQLTGKRVALKWMLPRYAREDDAVQRFMREAQAAGRIDHPNVVDVYDVGQDEGSWFLVMELLHGEPLSAALQRKRLSPRQVTQLLIPAMRGVAAAHRHGVVHRDLKPDNIFLCRGSDGRYRMPKVLDFGISKLSASDGDVNPRLTRTGAVVGTPYYMSPEQIRGASTVDQRADVYAFGVILYEALTGRVPFTANTYSALVLEIATGTPTPPSELNDELPLELNDIVMRAMARELPDRFADIETLARALEPFAEGVLFRSTRPDPTGPHPRVSRTSDTPTPFTSESQIEIVVPVSRRPMLLGVGLLLALGGLALGAWWLGEGDGGATEADAPLLATDATDATDVGEATEAPALAAAATPTADAAVPEATAAQVESPPAPQVEAAVAGGGEVEAPRAARRAAQERKRAARRARREAAARAPRSAPRAPPSSPTSATPAPEPKAAPRGRTGSLAVDDF